MSPNVWFLLNFMWYHHQYDLKLRNFNKPYIMNHETISATTIRKNGFEALKFRHFKIQTMIQTLYISCLQSTDLFLLPTPRDASPLNHHSNQHAVWWRFEVVDHAAVFHLHWASGQTSVCPQHVLRICHVYQYRALMCVAMLQHEPIPTNLFQFETSMVLGYQLHFNVYFSVAKQGNTESFHPLSTSQTWHHLTLTAALWSPLITLQRFSCHSHRLVSYHPGLDSRPPEPFGFVAVSLCPLTGDLQNPISGGREVLERFLCSPCCFRQSVSFSNLLVGLICQQFRNSGGLLMMSGLRCLEFLLERQPVFHTLAQSNFRSVWSLLSCHVMSLYIAA